MSNGTTTSGLTFDIRLSTERKTPQEREAILENPGFGKVFTDHMVTIRYTADRGWHDARLEPYGPLSLDPATSVLHYAQEIFEGSKRTATPTAASPASGRKPTPHGSTPVRSAWRCRNFPKNCSWGRSTPCSPTTATGPHPG